MRLSKEGADALVRREGKKNKAYRDTKGILTIGVGHTGSDFGPESVWTDKQVLDTFMRDVAWAENAVSKVRMPLNQHMFDALVSFVFNIGETAFANSTMLKFLNMGLYNNAAMEFDRWNKPKEIIGRRDQERTQFLTPV